MGEEEVVDKHVRSILWLRELFLEMDEFAKPVMGVGDWDDAVCVDFGGKRLLVSVDGPYTKRLVMKSALIHAATDVVVKGGRPIFALDALIGKKEDVKEMAESLRRQASAMKIPVLGGNTLFEDAEPRCTITVVGELLLDEPIRDSGMKKGDVLALLGEPIWGGQAERIEKAEKMFSVWYAALGEIKINAAKDVTKGGLSSALYEMSEKSKKEVALDEEVPYSRTRNLDNFLISLPREDFKRLKDLCKKKDCPLVSVGVVK
jgi:selenophosphate synthetase-related protein